VARQLAADGVWRRILTDPACGALLDVGTRRYRPPPSLAEHVIVRDQTCRFPGCRIPAHRCDLDHSIAHDPQAGQGPTSDDNLNAKCRTHHRVKQAPGWSVTRHPDGCVTWRTPSGHEYTSTPSPVIEPETPRPPPDPDEPPPF
ncbi:MAG: HNH endonuclease signature motif containing protein, partial [Pseudonocardiaceae bacterium]